VRILLEDFLNSAFENSHAMPVTIRTRDAVAITACVEEALDLFECFFSMFANQLISCTEGFSSGPA